MAWKQQHSKAEAALNFVFSQMENLFFIIIIFYLKKAKVTGFGVCNVMQQGTHKQKQDYHSQAPNS